MRRKGLLALVSSLCLPVLMHASAIYITTGQTGAQTQMDLNHDSVFAAPSLTIPCNLTGCATALVTYFDPTFDWDLAGGDFTMKDGGSGTVANVTFSFYDSVAGLLGSVNYTVNQFCTAHGGNCQSYDSTKFTFAGGPITLTSGHHYYATLTSSAADEQSEAYFIKGLDAVGFSPHAPTAPTNDPPTNDPPTTSGVPEPGSVVLMLGGAIGLAFLKRK
jgi:hypothetical protein